METGKERRNTQKERTLPRHLEFPFGSSFTSRFPIVTVTNYHKLSGLKHQELILFKFCMPEVQNDSFRDKVKVLAGLVLLKAPREDAFFASSSF